MQNKIKPILTFFCLLSLLSFVSADFEDIVVIINSVSTDPALTGSSYQKLSLEGGSYIYIKGSGFSSRSADSNSVTIDLIDCPIIEFLTTSTQVVCQVPASSTAKSATVRITVESTRNGVCTNCVTYANSATPQLLAMIPNAANPGDQVFYYGVQRVPSSLYVDYVKIGDERCDPSDQNEFDYVTFNGGNEQAPCNVSSILEAGFYNVSQMNLQSTGLAKTMATLPTYRFNGNYAYDFAVVPKITSINSNVGSPQGQIITIEGSGFSSTEDNEVLLGDTACTIISQSTSEIQCELQPRSASPSTQAWHSGLKYEFYSNQSISTVKSGTAGTSANVTSWLTTEIAPNQATNYTTKLSGYFKAPTTGNYKFLLANDDIAQLYISTSPLDKSNLQLIIDSEKYTAFRFFYTSGYTQTSDEIALVADNYYYIELYHTQYSGSDSATLGVQIPNAQNTINPTTEVQSIKLICPTVYEILEFRITGATGGAWNIKFNYLSSDGKSITSTSVTDDIAYLASASTVQSEISSTFGLSNSAALTMYDTNGAVTTNSTEATVLVYQVTFLALRKNGALPIIVSTNLTGSVTAKVTQLQAPSDPIGGNFTISYGVNSVDLSPSTSASTMISSLIGLGYQEPIRVSLTGDTDLGAEWRINFVGDGAGPINALTVRSSLTGCSDPSGISINVTTIQDSSQDLFYEAIPVELLFTAEDVSQITVKSNGILANCPGFNCQYTIQTTGIPEITVASYSGTTLSLSIANVNSGDYNSDDLIVTFGNVVCDIDNYDQSSSPVTISATCSNPEAGDFLPKVHFEGLGYASIDSSIAHITISLTISSVSPTIINPNGGTVLTVSGSGFPSSLANAQTRGISLTINSVACSATSVSYNTIVCTTGAVSSSDYLTIGLNSKTATSPSALSILSSPPTITDVSPNNVNPVLQTDITITGTNFDSDDLQTSIYLANTASDDVQECLVVNSTSTVITCKLLGAPTGTYNFYVQTSLGYSNQMSFTVETTITSISPTSGSIAGGTLITIQGGTFSDDTSQTLVSIGTGSDVIDCTVVTSTSTQVTCITGAMQSTSSQVDTAQTVFVDTRIVESAVCKGSCSFTYSSSLTPSVTALDQLQVSAGGTLTITGTDLDSNPSGTNPTVTIDGVTCTINSASSTSISVTIPQSITPDANATLIVSVAGKGYAQFDSSLNGTVSVSPAISAISPTSGSTAGTLLTITGAGFQDGTSVTVGGKTCAIRSLSSTSIVCKATTSGEVAVSYGSFSNVKCSTACTLSTLSSSTPTVSSISPLSPSTTAFTLTVQGTQLDLGTTSITLISKTDTSISFTGTVSTSSSTGITATFTDVAAGSYSVEIASGNNLASTSSTVSVPLLASISSSISSSIGGGISLTISGSGFFDNGQSSNNQVSVCGFDCSVTASTPSSITCETPLFINSAVISAYSSVSTPSVLTPVDTWSDTGKESTVFDSAFTTSYSSSNTACYIGVDYGLNLLAELSQIRFFPDPSITSSTLNGTVIEGSNDNVTFTLITTIDVNAYDGWNTLRYDDLTTPITYRFFRLREAGSNAKCALSELQIYGVILSNNSATDLNSITCDATVTINDKVQTISNAVNYKLSITGSLTSVSPNLGTTAGGTAVTLTGTNFGTTNAADVEVYIDNVACTVTSVSDTQIVCTTGAAPPISSRQSSLESYISINIAGRGSVLTNSLTYFYIDRWSDINTWGGITPPREGDSVSIPAGQIVLLDISPPKLNAIIIQGALVFEDTDIDLHCNYILISEGRLQIGTADQPMKSKISVTVYGNKNSSSLPTFGNKVIALMGGILDIHGQERSYTWTVLETTANIGDTMIVVNGTVDWVSGETIVIASTDHDHYQSESRVISAALTDTPLTGQTTLTFADALQYRHYAGIQTIDGVDFEMRAEVGLLTRNVVIQGDETSQTNQYGVHIMAHSNGDDTSIGRISYTEVRQAGQAYNLGRYPIHFHLIGNVRESYVLGNAIHHTYNRAITIHGVHNLKVQKNVAYWVMGHTIFIEDGIETHNVIEDNLVINTMASTSLLNTDQTPACFWITHPNNIWRRNHAAGSDRYGFWFDLRAHPQGPSATDTICPVGEKLGEFTDNQAHSSGRYGLRIFHELIPRTYPCLAITPYEDNPPVPAVFTNFFGWKNFRDAIVAERIGAVTFKNTKSADNLRAGIEISDGDWSPPFTNQVEDAWIVAATPDNGDDISLYIDHQVRGLITPKKEYFIARGVNFYNFGTGMTAIETCSHCEHPAATTEGAISSYVEDLYFYNVTQRVRFNVPYKEIIYDNDGTLTGTGSKGVVTYFYDHLNISACTLNDAVFNGLVCDSTVTIRKIELSNLVDFANFYMEYLDIYNLDNANRDSNPGSIPYRSVKTNWAVPFITGLTYRLSWRSRADFSSVLVQPSEVWETGDQAVSLVFNHSEYRETYDLIGESNAVNITNKTTLWTDSSANGLTCGDWYHDVDNQLLYVAITPNTIQDIEVEAVKCRLNCPIPVVNTPKDGIIRLWSNATQWPNQTLPKEGDDVEIPANWTLVLDMSPPSLGFLHVKGDFYFDDTQDGLVLTAQRIWVEGQLFIGNNTDDRYTNNAKIVLTGTRNSETLIIGDVQDVSNKVLAVTGNVTMYGKYVKNTFVRLLAPVEAGSTKITVDSSIDWSVGDEIFLAPSQLSEDEFETRTIQAISSGVITLNESLSYYHFGASDVTKTTTYGTIDMRTEVGLLTRNIKIVGTEEDYWGGRLYVGEIYSSFYDYYFRGRADLDGVELQNVGQANTTLGGLTFDTLTSANNDDSSVTRCVVRESQGISLRVTSTTGVSLTNNVFYKSYRYQLYFDGTSSSITFTNNLAVGNSDRGLKADAGDESVDFISLLYATNKATSSDFSNNIFAGCYFVCVTFPGGACSTQASGPYTFANNVVHSGQTGWLATAPDTTCNGITHFTGYHLEEGVMSYFSSATLKATNILITDTLIGVALNVGGSSLDSAAISLSNSYFAGVSSDAASYKNLTECSDQAAVFISANTQGIKSIPPMSAALPWYKIKTYHNWKGTFTVSDCTFENFADNIVPGCVGNHILESNPFASDDSCTTTVSGLTLNNVGSENLIKFNVAQDAWIGIDDCGGWYCTGIKNIVVRDLDGSLTGQVSSLIPINPGVLDSSTCTISTTQNAYICTQTGWGLLTFQSEDYDLETRILSPVNVTTSDGFRNDLNSYMDHEWDGFYTSLNRLSRFHSVVQAAKEYIIKFTSTLPNVLRWGLQGALSTEAITVQFGYEQPTSVRITDQNGNVIKQTIIQANGDDPITSADGCGTNTYSIDERKVTMKLTGESTCELKSTVVNSIQISVRYNISVNDFYSQDGTTSFVDRVAAILGINPASIRVVQVKSGSSITLAFVDSQYQGSDVNSTEYANNELNNFVQTLTESVQNGDLQILNSDILDSSFKVVLSNPDNLNSSSPAGKIVIIVAAVVAFIALVIGGYFAYGKYLKKKVIPSTTINVKQFDVSKFQESYLNTENPLVLGTASRIEGLSQNASPELKTGGISINFNEMSSPYKPVTFSSRGSPEKPLTPELQIRDEEI